MTVDRKNTEIFDQKHQMFAEGTSDLEPKKHDIEKLLIIENWNASNIEIFFDNMQGFWRWKCDISKKFDSTFESWSIELSALMKNYPLVKNKWKISKFKRMYKDGLSVNMAFRCWICSH